jgi:hypothetical protein
MIVSEISLKAVIAFADTPGTAAPEKIIVDRRIRMGE